ncbi:MAG: sigma-70 family RNA polymerase sigma factor [Deltaproteobacteria bacterium]|nr:MAG: sigma-70 family RNA polymerase sigma factor [Deltaproteobacteria bacterium]
MGRRRYLPPATLVKNMEGGSDAPSSAEGIQREEFALLERSRRGDRKAYGRIVELYQRRVFGLVCRVVGSESAAEDITQEAFVRAYLAIDRFDTRRPFLPWIFRIALNLSRNWLKAAARRETSCDPDILQSRLRPADECHGDRERLQRALSRLAPKYRIPLVLKHVEGLDYNEMKDVLKLPVSVLKMRVSRARRMLAKLLEEEEGTGRS